MIASVWPEPLAWMWSIASSMLSTSSSVNAASPYSCLQSTYCPVALAAHMHAQRAGVQ